MVNYNLSLLMSTLATWPGPCLSAFKSLSWDAVHGVGGILGPPLGVSRVRVGGREPCVHGGPLLACDQERITQHLGPTFWSREVLPRVVTVTRSPDLLVIQRFSALDLTLC